MIGEEDGADGVPLASAGYMNGTIISAEGHIAATIGEGASQADVRRFLKKVTVSLPGGRTGQARLMAYDSQTGAALLKVNASGLPYLELSNDPIAVNRRLTVHAIGHESTGREFRAAVPAQVMESRFKLRNHNGFFTVSEGSQNSLTGEYAGAPVVTSSGRLQGILSSTDEALLRSPDGTGNPRIHRAAAIPVSVIAKLLDEASEPPESTGDKPL